MKTLATGKDNDLIVQGGRFVFAKDADAIANISKNNLLTNYGELVYDALRGIRYFDYVFSGVLDIENFRRDAISEIMRISGVNSVPLFAVNLENGTLYYTAVIATIYGEVTINAGN